MTRTKEQLIIENDRLKSRLAETEEALAAIRGGEVDAIVVPGRAGEQIYSISSAETPYRTFIEEMDEGAVTLSGEGIVIYCNHRFAEQVKEPIEQVVGSSFRRFLVPGDRPAFDKLMKGRARNVDNVLVISLVSSIYLKLSFHHMPAYLQGDNCIIVATDISELKRKERILLEMSNQLEEKLNIIQQLRMQLIEKNIDSEAEIRALKDTNKKLVQEIGRNHGMTDDFQQKTKQQTRIK